ncbi:sigma-70 family RNA polymerase sigma factor [Lactobacillus sp. DCY120]|uniref:Sigma-70 family RNA polymerase sigma factor n=1 Tax=Bombilactobacillus apium TaxID=2675299 RepID=A0A850RAZ5_9LACO|nr:sigma-70 family RNA polymerase sigma factor [Bombilactobacillus apium]NVY95988.1 sigma-70 family RNA polymerase sigma factor [Bombilactobacillus apium]
MESLNLLQEEQHWIRAVKLQHSSQSLEQLFKKYRPMIENLCNLHQLRLYDREDWYQEARIVCFETCLIYDCSQGSKFGSFFKLRLKNHLANLLRYQLAFKRRSNVATVSFEQLLQEDPELEDLLAIFGRASNERIIFEYRTFIHQLSTIEIKGFQILLGLNTPEQVTQSGTYTKVQVQRAMSRSRVKFRSFCQAHGLDT